MLRYSSGSARIVKRKNHRRSVEVRQRCTSWRNPVKKNNRVVSRSTADAPRIHTFSTATLRAVPVTGWSVEGGRGERLQVITPRRTRLLRVPDLRTRQRAIVSVVETRELQRARGCAVVVPTRAAAEQLRRTFELRLLGPQAAGVPDHTACAVVLPDIVSREAWYGRMHAGLPSAPGRLTSFEREALFHSAIRDAIASGARPPFESRPGLVAEMASLYESIGRLGHSIDTFERLMVGELEPSAEFDRGANRLLRQTRFLVATFRAYQERMTRVDRVDEADLRRRLLETPRAAILRHLVVTVADRSADPSGLWPADFDLLARLPGLERIDLVATEAVLATGFYERLHARLPGLEEVRVEEPEPDRPVLLMPTQDRSQPFFVRRDREEELRAIAARLQQEVHHGSGEPAARGASGAHRPERTAIVFQRPLPYLYLTRRTLGAAGIPDQTLDGTPLAAEPFAATLDLVLSFVLSGFTRGTTLALLRSPQLRFEVDATPLDPGDLTALDRRLRSARYLGGRERLRAMAAEWAATRGESIGESAAVRGARVAAAAAFDLRALERPARPTVHLDLLVSFLHGRQRPISSRTAVRGATAARTRGGAGRAAGSSRCSRGARRRGGRVLGSGGEHPAQHRGQDLRPISTAGRRAPRRRARRGLRGLRRGLVGWSRSGRLARAAAAQRLLPALAPERPGMAARVRPAGRRSRRFSRSARPSPRDRRDLHVHAGERRHRAALGAARRPLHAAIRDRAGHIRGRAVAGRSPRGDRCGSRPGGRPRDDRGLAGPSVEPDTSGPIPPFMG